MIRLERLTKWERAIQRAKAAPTGRKWIARAAARNEATAALKREVAAVRRWQRADERA